MKLSVDKWMILLSKKFPCRNTEDVDDDVVDAIEITFLLPLFPQTAPIDEGLTRQCLQIVDLGFRGIEGR